MGRSWRNGEEKGQDERAGREERRRGCRLEVGILGGLLLFPLARVAFAIETGAAAFALTVVPTATGFLGFGRAFAVLTLAVDTLAVVAALTWGGGNCSGISTAAACRFGGATGFFGFGHWILVLVWE